MIRMIAFILLGYLSGSVLFGRVSASLIQKRDIFEGAKDQNPGTANAFQYGGFWCGILTLIGDLAKGWIPVYLYIAGISDTALMKQGLALVLAAPVFGHIFPLFYGFQGGKGIAVTFGCLLGLLPEWKPAVLLAAFFIFFSLVLRITPHFYRTIIAYVTTLICLVVFFHNWAVSLGFLLITVMVCYRLHKSSEKLESIGIKLLWMR